MEGLRLGFEKAAKRSNDPCSASSLPSSAPRRAVSVLTCSKLCGFCFVGGIIVGFTLKRRLRRWASRLLRIIKDD